MLHLRQSQKEAIIRHAQAEAPLEACGLLAGQGTTVLQVYTMENAERSESVYRLEPEEQYRTFVEIEENGLELVGIYHSHPSTPAYPSPRDISMAYYPEVAYMIVSLMDDAAPDIQAFRIREGEVTQEEIGCIRDTDP